MGTTQAVLTAEGLRYRYGETVALDGVDLRGRSRGWL